MGKQSGSQARENAALQKLARGEPCSVSAFATHERQRSCGSQRPLASDWCG